MQLVSVIIPAYNAETYIGEALESVCSQSYAHWEIVVVDDASRDRTEEVVQRFRKRGASRRVEFLRHGVNLGVSAARNTAIQAARGDWLAFLDHDDIWTPHHLESSVRHLESTSGDLCFCPVDRIGVNAEVCANYPILALSPDWMQRLFQKNEIVLSSVVLRRSALDPDCLFDQAPDIQHCEDYDLWLRLAEQGKKFVRAPEVGVQYRIHESQATAREGMMLDREWVVMCNHFGTFPSSRALKRRRMSDLALKAGMFFWSSNPSKSAYYLRRAFGFKPWGIQLAWLALKASIR